MTSLRPWRNILFAFSLIGLSLVVFWAGHRFCELRNTREFFSQGRFGQMRWLLLSYHQEHGAFPPTKYQPEADGPIHSWRVLLLPYIDSNYSESYSQYDFSQEWNSPKNLQAVGGMDNYFSSFRWEDNAAHDFANYLSIGDEEDWPSDKPLKAYLLIKGKDRFLIVEYPDSAIHWMEPKY